MKRDLKRQPRLSADLSRRRSVALGLWPGAVCAITDSDRNVYTILAGVPCQFRWKCRQATCHSRMHLAGIHATSNRHRCSVDARQNHAGMTVSTQTPTEMINILAGVPCQFRWKCRQATCHSRMHLAGNHATSNRHRCSVDARQNHAGMTGLLVNDTTSSLVACCGRVEVVIQWVTAGQAATPCRRVREAPAREDVTHAAGAP